MLPNAQVILLRLAPQVARITGVCHCSLITLISSIRQ